jgi:putative hydrolase of the HAD superfamily
VVSDLIFDFFGTLVHYTPGAFHTASYEKTHRFLQQQGFPLSYAAFVDTFTAVSDELEAQAKLTFHEYHMADVGRRFFQAAFATDVTADVLEPFIEHFIAEWGRGIVPLDGLAPFLAQLAARYRLSIVSNTHYPPIIHEQLAAMQVAPYFSQVITSIEMGIRKPHPAIFAQALAQMQITPHNALYIGDTYVDDYQGATGAGMRCVLLDPRQRYTEVPERVATLFDLLPYLEQMQEPAASPAAG